MALFLESGVNTQVHTKYTDLSLNECLCEGINLTQEMMDLQEAVFKADYILSQKNQGLSESVQALNEAGFLSSVWEKTKAILGKIWEWIKATWKKLIDKLTEWANRIGDRLAGKTKEIKKSTIKKAELMESVLTGIISKCISAVDKISGNPDNETLSDLKEEINNIMERYNEDVTEADKLEGRETVSDTFAKKITGTANRLQKDITKAISSLEKLKSNISKELESVKDDGKSVAGVVNNSGFYNKNNGIKDRGDHNMVVTANHKIGFIKSVTSILKNATTKSANTAASVMSSFGSSKVVNKMGNSKGSLKYREEE